MEGLPLDIIQCICLLLQPIEVLRFSGTCQKFYQFINDNGYIWKNLLPQEEQKKISTEKNTNISWKKIYRSYHFDQKLKFLQCQKRLLKERHDEINPQDTRVQLFPISEDDLFKWEGIIFTKYSPYCNGKFILNINIPREYPLKPPQIIFKSKIFHVNVDDSGKICMDLLQEDGQWWSPVITLRKVLLAIESLLYSPYLENGLIHERSKLYRENRSEYFSICQEWTTKYSSQ